MNEDEMKRSPGLGSETNTGTTVPPPPLPGSLPTTGRPNRGDRPNFGIGTRTEAPTARWPEVALIVGAGFFANLAFRSGFATASAAISGVLIIMALVGAGRKLQRDALGLILLAALLLPWLLIRSNAALTSVTVLMVLMLLAVASGLSRTGRLTDSKLRGLAKHVWAMAYEWLFGSVMVKRLLIGTSSQSQSVSLLRGIIVAAPVLLLFGLLLASADEVFAQLFVIGSLPEVVGHVIGTTCAAVALLGYLSRRSHETPTGSHKNLRGLGPLEVTIVLGSVATLFLAFVVTQVVVALGGADHVLETEGLTQADHARRGFFQLLWVAGLSMSLVGLLRAFRRTHAVDGENALPSRDRFTPLALLTLLLTVLIASISVQRLLLYIGSFGLTPLRLWALLGTAAIVLAILLYVVSIAGYRSEQSWYPAVAILLSFGVVVALNVMNPDAVIANYNISNAETGPVVDVDSLTSLSDDATTTIVDRLIELGPAESSVVNRLCNRLARETTYGALEYNVAAVSSDRALDELCSSRPTPDTAR